MEEEEMEDSVAPTKKKQKRAVQYTRVSYRDACTYVRL
jgi:hypothetical protein